MLVTRFQFSQNLKISISFLVSPLLYVVGTERSVVGRVMISSSLLKHTRMLGNFQFDDDPGELEDGRTGCSMS